MNIQKIALFGTSGELNYSIAAKALKSGHYVTVIVPDKSQFIMHHPNLRIVRGDVKNKEDIRRYAKGHDSVIYTLESIKTQLEELVDITCSVIEGVKDSGVHGLLFAAHPVGLPIETSEGFYSSVKSFVKAQREALELFQNQKQLRWGYAHSIAPEAEEKKGKYRISHEVLFTYPEGEYRLPETEYASAIINEAEKSMMEFFPEKVKEGYP